jgi:CubicO group peptidase (beta-lactamase class C family)
MKFVLHLIVFILLGVPSFAQTQTGANQDQQLNLKLENYLTEMEKAGLTGSALIELPDGSIISRGCGFRNLESNQPNDAATVFDIGSLTKQFTAAAILKLEMVGKLSVNDPITMYFEMVPEDKQNITIHDLLRHQSGLISNIGKDYEKIEKTEFLSKLFSTKLKFKPGDNFSYSNVGYTLLALIIEKVSGQSYESFLYENLWQPALMEHTGYSRPAFNKDLVAIGYSNDNTAWGRPTEKEWDGSAPYLHLFGNGGVLSTTEDMFKWSKALQTNLIFNEDATKRLLSPKLRAVETEESYYAYGWDVAKTSRNTTRIWHNGSNRIFYADVMIFPQDKVVLIWLSNKSNDEFNDLNMELTRIIFNPDYIPTIPAAENDANRKFTTLVIETIKSAGLTKARSIYSAANGNPALLEYVMRQEGFTQLDNGNPKLALEIFEMNLFAYPQSAKAIQGLAEGYMETGKNELALKYFKESLRLNDDNPFVKDMIRKLEK